LVRNDSKLEKPIQQNSGNFNLLKEKVLLFVQLLHLGAVSTCPCPSLLLSKTMPSNLFCVSFQQENSLLIK
jgi:hypothetical protein